MCSAHLACRWLGRLFGKLFSTAFSGPPLGRPAWLCPGPAKMEKKIAAKMLLTSVEIGSKTLPGGSKIAPKWLLEACGWPLGSWGLSWGLPWAALLPPREAWGVPKTHLGGLGTPQERKVDRFYPPGGSPGGSRRGSGRSFLGLFCGWVGGNEKKAQKVPTNTDF